METERKITRQRRRNVIPNPKPRQSPPAAEVEIWAGSLPIRFAFDSQEVAEAFWAAAIKSRSVTAVSVFHKGKFVGARDGGAS